MVYVIDVLRTLTRHRRLLINIQMADARQRIIIKARRDHTKYPSAIDLQT